MDSVPVELVRDLVQNRKCTHKEVHDELRRLYPGKKGLSERSVRRFCSQNSIQRFLDDKAVAEVVSTTVSQQNFVLIQCIYVQICISYILQVGHTYGRKMMKGSLAAQGIVVSQRRVASAMRQVAPHSYYQRRQRTAEQVNPIRYHARYFGHKIHTDQNEELVMYGVTYVLCRDGYSGKILARAIMRRKNNLTIYETVYRSAKRQAAKLHLSVKCVNLYFSFIGPFFRNTVSGNK